MKVITDKGEVTLYPPVFKVKCGDYTVYENKVWKIVSSQGIYPDRILGLERERANEKTVIKDQNIIKELRKIEYPSSHITI